MKCARLYVHSFVYCADLAVMCLQMRSVYVTACFVCNGMFGVYVSACVLACVYMLERMCVSVCAFACVETALPSSTSDEAADSSEEMPAANRDLLRLLTVTGWTGLTGSSQPSRNGFVPILSAQ